MVSEIGGRDKDQLNMYIQEMDHMGDSGVLILDMSKISNQVSNNQVRQTSYLSKDLRDRNFGPQKFTQKKRNLR